MSTRLLLVGILASLTAVSACAGPAPQATLEPSPMEKAETTLLRYFSLLSEGDYSQAAKLYGGDYALLAEWNPDIDPNDHAALLESGCTVNGLQCLPIKEVLISEQIAEDTYRFSVQFQNPDGSLFVRGPSSGATEEEMPSQSEFEFTVVGEGENFVVQELPVYVP